MIPPASFPACASLVLRLFGKFQAKRNDLPLPDLHIREGTRLLAFLTLRSEEPVTAREIAERFWPAEARGNLIGQNDFPSLRQSLHSLRKALGPDAYRRTRPSKATCIWILPERTSICWLSIVWRDQNRNSAPKARIWTALGRLPSRFIEARYWKTGTSHGR